MTARFKSFLTVVSGGQTGVDRAALDVALELGFPVGGWCPKGRLAEDGAIDCRYSLRETKSTNYAERTRKNVIDSDGTLILAEGELTGGTALTEQFTSQYGKPCFVVDISQVPDYGAVKRWIVDNHIKVLNVAGPRESTMPGIWQHAKQWLSRFLAELW